MMMMMMMDDVDKIGTPKPSECLGNAQAMYASHTGMMHERDRQVSGKENMVQQMRSTWGKKKKKSQIEKRNGEPTIPTNIVQVEERNLAQNGRKKRQAKIFNISCPRLNSNTNRHKSSAIGRLRSI